MDQNQYDPRIQMVAGYVRPRPKRKVRRWPRRVLRVVLSLVVLVAAGLVAEVWLASARIMPPLESAADYHPPAVTRLSAASGELVAEIAGARRRVVPADKMPEALAAAVMARLEPAYLTRRALGQVDLLRALIARLRGQAPALPLTLRLVRSLAGPSPGLERFVQEWLAAMRLERKIPRAALLQIFLNQVPFGRDVFGAEEGARARFGRSLGALDAAQLQALAELADGDAPPAHASAPVLKDGCGELAAQKLRERYEPDELSHLGAEVMTTCEPQLARAMGAAIAHATRERAGLLAAALVMRLPGQEVVAVVGDVSAPRAIGAMRAPFVFAAALQTKKWTMITPVEPDGPPLHVAALRSPVEAADALIAGGLSIPGTLDLVGKAGVATPIEAEAWRNGTAGVPPLELASALAALAEAGQHRLPQLLRAIDGVAESEGARAASPVFLPEVAYLVTALMQPPGRAQPPPSRPSASAWSALLSPDAVVLASVGLADAAPLDRGEAERVATAIARAVQAAALKGKPARAFARPPGLVNRRVDPMGKLLPEGTASGVEEWFVPGSVPRDEP
jgi:membrane carboxypeptidase/penicillin-binding protein